MILKSKSVKSKRGVKNVLRYILSGDKNQLDDFVITRFIRGDRPFEALFGRSEGILERSLDVLENRVENMFTQFEQNNEKRLIKRKNANRIYHEIISFNKLDSDKLNSKNLNKLARYYAKIRSKNSLVVSALHSDKEHLHVHNVISAVEFETGKAVRLSRSDFKNVKLNLEAWQEKNLGLIHSRVNHNKKKEQPLLKDVEFQINLRGQRSKKQLLQLQLAESFSSAKSSQDFYQRIEKKGLQLYERGGHIIGILDNQKKYRLKTLGFSKERIASLKREIYQEQNPRLKELYELQNRNFKDIELER